MARDTSGVTEAVSWCCTATACPLPSAEISARDVVLTLSLHLPYDTELDTRI